MQGYWPKWWTGAVAALGLGASLAAATFAPAQEPAPHYWNLPQPPAYCPPPWPVPPAAPAPGYPAPGQPQWQAPPQWPATPPPQQPPTPPTPRPGEPATPRPQEPGGQAPDANRDRQPGANENLSAQAPSQPTAAPATSYGNVMGDFFGGYLTTRTQVLNYTVSQYTLDQFGSPIYRNLYVSETVKLRVPVLGGGAFKIAENESPLPQTRAFVNYNYFSLRKAVRSSQATFVADTGETGAFPSATVAPTTELQRLVFGGEYAFFGDRMSVGVRLPFYQADGLGTLQVDDARVAAFTGQPTPGVTPNRFSANGVDEDSHFADPSFIFKYALAADRQAGYALSVGTVVTVPLGPDTVSQEGHTLHPWLIQPFWGGLLALSEDLFVQGFNAIVLPTSHLFPTLVFVDVALGYQLYRSQGQWGLTAVQPALEFHLNFPVTHKTTDAEPVSAPASLNLTTGLHLEFNRATTLQLGVVFPLASESRAFQIEGLLQLNARF